MERRRIIAGGLTPLAVAAGGMTALAGGETEEVSYNDQIPAFVGQVSTWKPKAKGSYAYTDLDQNGRLEILTSSSRRGKTTIGLWEYDGGRMTEAELPWEKGDEEPSIIESPVTVYHDTQEEVYYYIFGSGAPEDRMETGGGDAAATALSYQDGVLSAETLEEDPEARFEGMEKMTATIGWVSTAEHPLTDANPEQITEIGGQSLSAYKLKKAD